MIFTIIFHARGVQYNSKMKKNKKKSMPDIGWNFIPVYIKPINRLIDVFITNMKKWTILSNYFFHFHFYSSFQLVVKIHLNSLLCFFMANICFFLFVRCFFHQHYYYYYYYYDHHKSTNFVVYLHTHIHGMTTYIIVLTSFLLFFFRKQHKKIAAEKKDDEWI